MGFYLGVDLGTTFTAAATIEGGGGQPVMESLGNQSVAIPSTLFIADDGTVLVGEPANRRGIEDPMRYAREFKRRLGDTVPLILGKSPYSAEALLAFVLSKVVGQVAERHGGNPDVVAVTHPANWSAYKRERLADAIYRAGLGDPRREQSHTVLLSEPEAAARYYASTRPLAAGQLVAVYDLGGGTFDVTVLEKTEDGFLIRGVPQGIEQLGGVDFDASVLSHIDQVTGGAISALSGGDALTRQKLARLRNDAVEAKETLSSDTRVSIPVSLPNLETTVGLTRPEFEAMVRAPLAETIEALRRALRSANVGPKDLHSVLLVGGSSRIPLVKQLVETELGCPVSVDVHPKHAVALGAALAAESSAMEAPTQSTPTTPTQSTPVQVAAPSSAPPAPTPAAPVDPTPAQRPAEPSVPLEEHPVPPAGAPAIPLRTPSDARPPARKGRRVPLIAAAVVMILAAAVAVILATRGTSYSSKLEKALPPALSSSYSADCTLTKGDVQGSVAFLHCGKVSGLFGGAAHFVEYYAYKTSAEMNSAYQHNWVKEVAETTEGTSCSASFSGGQECPWPFGSGAASSEGRLLETYSYQPAPLLRVVPSLIFTDSRYDVMAVVVGAPGQSASALLAQWSDNAFTLQ